MKLPKPTPEELYRELNETLLDLCGDVLLLECLLFPGDRKSRPNLWKCQKVRAALARRLVDYAEQHAKDAVSVAEALRAAASKVSAVQNPPGIACGDACVPVAHVHRTTDPTGEKPPKGAGGFLRRREVLHRKKNRGRSAPVQKAIQLTDKRLGRLAVRHG